MDLKDKIIEYAKELSLDTIGFTECRRFDELGSFFQQRIDAGLLNEFEEEDIEKRINPFLLMEDGKTIISIAFPYYHGDNCDGTGFSLYTRGKDYHKVVKEYLTKICEFMRSTGGKAEYFVDSNPLPERYIASLCGIGFIGKNNTLITEKYGSYVFLGEIITDIKLAADNPLDHGCMNCNLCMEKCPTNVIIGNVIRFNSKRCVSYLTQKKHLSDEEIPLISGRLFGCDTCQKVCPHNRHISNSPIEEFIPHDFMEVPNILNLVNMSNGEFKEKYINCSCGWRGKNILMRNALINYYSINKKDMDNIKIEIKSPYLKDYYDRLFEKK